MTRILTPKPVTPILQPGDPLNRGLVGAWLQSSRGAGDTARDWSRRGSHGDIVGGASWQANGVLGLNGSDGYLNPFYYVDGPTHTASCWVYLNSFTERINILGCNDGQDRRFYLQIRDPYINDLIIGIGDTFATMGNPPPTETWLFYVLTADGSTATLYENLKEVGSSSYTWGGGVSDDSAWIGGFKDDTEGSIRHVDGLFSDVRIWNRALTYHEIQRLANPDYREWRVPDLTSRYGAALLSVGEKPRRVPLPLLHRAGRMIR